MLWYDTRNWDCPPIVMWRWSPPYIYRDFVCICFYLYYQVFSTFIVCGEHSIRCCLQALAPSNHWMIPVLLYVPYGPGVIRGSSGGGDWVPGTQEAVVAERGSGGKRVKSFQRYNGVVSCRRLTHSHTISRRNNNNNNKPPYGGIIWCDSTAIVLSGTAYVPIHTVGLACVYDIYISHRSPCDLVRADE